MKRKANIVTVPLLRGFGITLLSATLAVGCAGEVTGGKKSATNDPEIEAPELPRNPGMVDGVDDHGNPLTFVRPSFKCDTSLVGGAVAMRKLTNTQYQNSVLDLFRWALGKNDVSDIKTAMASGFSKMPPEHRDTSVHHKGTFRQMDQALQAGHVEHSYDIALAVGKVAANDHMELLLKDCKVEQGSQCIRAFIHDFGAKALRRPLDDAEEIFYESFYGDLSKLDKPAFADLVAGFLTAPQFLYMVEHGDAPVGGKQDVFELSAYELASRLSYHFIQSLPDAELQEKAASGALLDPGTYAAQVDRLLADERARASTEEFFSDFLQLDALPDFTSNLNKPDYKTFVGQTAMPSTMLRQAVTDDVVDMFQYFTWDMDGKYDDLLTTDLSFASSTELANIYGVEPWDRMGGGPPVSLPAGERPGLVTRAALLATELVSTRPINKGVYLRSGLMCEDIPPPPDGAANAPRDTVDRTARETVELITEQDGTACKGCHQTYINHLGYPTESFDALGRHRREELVFDGERKHIGFKPVDTRAQPRVFIEDASFVDDAAGLARKIADSGKAHACLARNYFRFTFARMEDWNDGIGSGEQTSRDGCVLERLRRAVDKGGSLRTMIREVVMAPEFKQRLIAQ